jgi:hypothetical protein
MISLIARWLIRGAFEDEWEKRFSQPIDAPVAAKELQSFIKSVFKTRIKHLTIVPDSIDISQNMLAADGSVAKVFDYQNPDKIVKCQIEIYASSDMHPGGSIKVNLVDVATGEIRQLSWHI